MKVALTVLVYLMASRAPAFNRLSCTGDTDVRLVGRSKVVKANGTFSLTRETALEIDVYSEGILVGKLFPWDKVIWNESPKLNGFRDLRFKTDNETLIALSFYDIAHKRAHRLDCDFRFD